MERHPQFLIASWSKFCGQRVTWPFLDNDCLRYDKRLGELTYGIGDLEYKDTNNQRTICVHTETKRMNRSINECTLRPTGEKLFQNL